MYEGCVRLKVGFNGVGEQLNWRSAPDIALVVEQSNRCAAIDNTRRENRLRNGFHARHSPLGAMVPPMRTIVNGLLTRKGCVLLVRRAPHRAFYPRLWSFPGGHVESNETLPDALVRELREEVGISPTTYTHMGVIIDPHTPPSDLAAYHMYWIVSWEGGEPTILGDEHTELAWVPLKAAATVPDLALEEYRPLFMKLALLHH